MKVQIRTISPTQSDKLVIRGKFVGPRFGRSCIYHGRRYEGIAEDVDKERKGRGGRCREREREGGTE